MGHGGEEPLRETPVIEAAAERPVLPPEASASQKTRKGKSVDFYTVCKCQNEVLYLVLPFHFMFSMQHLACVSHSHHLCHLCFLSSNVKGYFSYSLKTYYI